MDARDAYGESDRPNTRTLADITLESETRRLEINALKADLRRARETRADTAEQGLTKERIDAWWTCYYLKRMAQEGSAVSLSWDEEAQMWECSWIAGGKRATGFDRNMLQAISKAIKATGNPDVLCGKSMQPGS